MKNKRLNKKKANLFAVGGGLPSQLYVPQSASVPTKFEGTIQQPQSHGMSQGMMGGISAAGSAILGAIPNMYGEQTLAEKAVYGDSTQDPIARLMGDISGSNVRRAQKEINKQATDTALGLSEATTNDALMSSWDNMSFQQDIKDPSALATIGDSLMASAKVANQGLGAGGPWGALVGGIVGGVANIGSLFGRNSRKKKIQRAIDKANALQSNAFSNQVRNVDSQNDFNLLANYSAYGGS